MASLGLVSPGTATGGVTPIFSLKLTTFLVITVCQFCSVTPIYFILKTDDLFCSSLSLLLISLWCHPLEGVTLYLFYLPDLVCPLFFVNSPTIFFVFRPPRPPSDATGAGMDKKKFYKLTVYMRVLQRSQSPLVG